MLKHDLKEAGKAARKDWPAAIIFAVFTAAILLLWTACEKHEKNQQNIAKTVVYTWLKEPFLV